MYLGDIKGVFYLDVSIIHTDVLVRCRTKFPL